MLIRNINHTLMLLHATPIEHLNLTDWTHGNPKSLKDLRESCGTTACIGGLIALSPRWKKIGGTSSLSGSPIYRHPENGYLSAYDAIAWYWDVPRIRAKEICDPLFYPENLTPQQVKDKAITRINKLKKEPHLTFLNVL